MFKKECKFIIGAATAEDLEKVPSFPQVAFIGRSNVGKSSIINALMNNKTIAKTSATPGRTRQINFFNLADKLVIADLPGYGFAKAPKHEIRKWRALIFDYLVFGSQIRRVFVLVDSRRGIMDSDRDMFEILDEAAVPYQIVLTKIDKLKKNQLEKVFSGVNQEISGYTAASQTVLSTSSVKNTGIGDLRKEIEILLGMRK